MRLGQQHSLQTINPIRQLLQRQPCGGGQALRGRLRACHPPPSTLLVRGMLVRKRRMAARQMRSQPQGNLSKRTQPCTICRQTAWPHHPVAPQAW